MADQEVGGFDDPVAELVATLGLLLMFVAVIGLVMGVTSFGLGDQGSKPTGWKPPKKPKKGKPAPPVDRPTLDTFNDHLQSWQVVDAKIPTPPGWKPPSASCNPSSTKK